MPNFVMTKGELHKKAQQYNIIPALALLNDGNDTEIEVITLHQAKRDDANERAWLDFNVHSIADVEAKIEQILKEETHFQEFVLVNDDKITVGVNRDIIDDSAVDRAIIMLVEMDSFTVDSYKVFGDQI